MEGRKALQAVFDRLKSLVKTNLKEANSGPVPPQLKFFALMHSADDLGQMMAVGGVVPGHALIGALEAGVSVAGSAFVGIAKTAALALIETVCKEDCPFPSTPYAVAEMMRHGHGAIPEYLGGMIHEEGECGDTACPVALVQLATSAHLEAPSVQALIRAGSIREAAVQSAFLDTAGCIYAFSDGLLPLADEEAREMGESLRREWQAVRRDEGPLSHVEGDTDADVVASFLDGLTRRRDGGDPLPPQPPIAS